MSHATSFPLEPAARLEDVYWTLSPEPLIDPDQFNAFYRKELNSVRGGDRMAHLRLALNRSHGAVFYKALLLGHSGVGKSTELTRLSREVEEKFRTIRFSATNELDAANFRPFDVVLLMMIRLAEETAKGVAEGGARAKLPTGLLQDIRGWYDTKTIRRTEDVASGVEAAAGAGPKGGSLLDHVLGLFASIKGEIKYSADRKTEIVEYRLSRLSELIGMANRMLDECNRGLREAVGKEWLFLGEDFDKQGIPATQTQDLFLSYGNIFKDLRTHLVFTVPIGLVYSAHASLLPFPNNQIHCIPDTPVFQQEHSPHLAGREAVRAVLEGRVRPDLFDEGELDRLIVASGGNLRDLFSLVGEAADTAFLAGRATIGSPHSTAAIRNLRTDYERKLGQSPDDEAAISYEEKADRLVEIYRGDRVAQVPDPVLHSLLMARAVQEFNGERWFGVHPLVVDILSAQEKLKPELGGGVRGGTG